MSCNHGAASGKDKEAKNTVGIACRKAKSQVNWVCLWVTQRHTETCDAHAGGGTDSQTGTVAFSTVKKNEITR